LNVLSDDEQSVKSMKYLGIDNYNPKYFMLFTLCSSSLNTFKILLCQEYLQILPPK